MLKFTKLFSELFFVLNLNFDIFFRRFYSVVIQLYFKKKLMLEKDRFNRILYCLLNVVQICLMCQIISPALF